VGFKVQRNTYKLIFKDPAYEGLEVTARELSAGQLWEFIAAEKETTAGGDGAMEGRRKTMQMLADALVSWNAEDEDTGEPIPTTLEGLLSQGLGFAGRVMDAWTDALIGISAPLSQTSTAGDPSVEASIPMDAPYVSLAS
jgi:hypothetical protein